MSEGTASLPTLCLTHVFVRWIAVSLVYSVYVFGDLELNANKTKGSLCYWRPRLSSYWREV